MQEQPFRGWLRDVRGFSKEVIASRVSECKRVERTHDDLDTHYDADGMKGLIDLLTYTADDEQRGEPPNHNIQIEGSVRNVTAVLKAAVNLYRDFLGAEGWDRYLEDVRRYLGTDLLDSQEVNYKLRIGRKCARARNALLTGNETWRLF